MKQGLETKRLGEFCDIKHGYAFDGADFSTDYFGNNPIVLTPGNFSENATLIFNDKNTKRCTGDYSNNYVFNLGDLVVVMTDLSSKMKILGKPAIIENDNILHNQRIGRFVFFNDSINKKYLYYLLQSETYLKSIKDSATGTMVRHTAPQRILNFKIPVPPLTYQLRIVSIIDKAFATITTAKANAEQNLKNAKELFESYLQGVFEKKGEGWEVKTLNLISDNLDSKRVPITKSVRNEGSIPYYGASGIVDYVADYLFDEDLLCVSEDGANLLARTYPIAFSISGKTWVNNHAHILRFKSMVSQKFVELYLNSIKLDDFVSGMAQPKLNQAMLNKIPIPFPPLPEQESIVQRLDALSAETKKLEAIYQQKVVDLEELKKSVLQKAFNGEL